MNPYSLEENKKWKNLLRKKEIQKLAKENGINFEMAYAHETDLDGSVFVLVFFLLMIIFTIIMYHFAFVAAMFTAKAPTGIRLFFSVIFSLLPSIFPIFTYDLCRGYVYRKKVLTTRKKIIVLFKKHTISFFEILSPKQLDLPLKF
ncbi:MAG: hypothetical protein WAV31_06175 [Candidatus Moraniibacteriota bacterium]